MDVSLIIPCCLHWGGHASEPGVFMYLCTGVWLSKGPAGRAVTIITVITERRKYSHQPVVLAQNMLPVGVGAVWRTAVMKQCLPVLSIKP